MKLLNFHCSIVCSYCSVVCLNAKSELKMIKYSSSFKLNEIHKVGSHFNKNPKNINFFSREALISGEGWPENLGKMGNNKDIYCYANCSVMNFERSYQSLPPGTKILVMPRVSYMPDQILGKYEKKCQNLTFLYGPSLPKYTNVFKKVLYGQIFFIID